MDARLIAIGGLFVGSTTGAVATAGGSHGSTGGSALDRPAPLGRVVCPDCGSSSYLVVDGREMTGHDALHLERAPRKIERRLPHAVWCPSDDNRFRAMQSGRPAPVDDGRDGP